MTLFAYIPDTVVVKVGPLPDTGRRLDTGQVIYDLSTTGRQWARACGWYPVDHPEVLDELDLTDEQRAQIIVDVTAAITRMNRRQAVVAQVRTAANTAKDFAYDWLDLYSSIPIPGSPNAGQGWGPLTVAQKAEVLRDASSKLALWAIRTADAQLLLMDVLVELIDATDVDAPT